MNKIVARESDLKEPRLVVAHLNRLYDQAYKLLDQIGKLEQAVHSGAAKDSGGNAGLTDDERRLLQALARGSTESLVPATKPVVPIVDVLPPTATSTPGALIELRSSGVVYIFDGSNWNSITAAASPHNILSATHPDTLAAALVRGDLFVVNSTPKVARFPKGTARQLLQVDAGGNDLTYGGVADGQLSANVPLLNAANAFSGANVFTAINQFNALVKLLGGSVLAGLILTGTQTMGNENLISVDVSGGVATAKFPAVPIAGDWKFLIDDKQNAAVNNITLDGNGKNVNGAATKVINTNGGAALLFYNATQWTGKIW